MNRENIISSYISTFLELININTIFITLITDFPKDSYTYISNNTDKIPDNN